MPTLVMPDGQPVTFPDDMPKEQIRGLIESKFPDAFAPAPSVAADAAKSLGSGLVRGVTGIAELPGVARDIVGAGVEWLGRKVGVEPGQIPAGQEPPNLIPRPGSVTGAVERNITGKLYEPQTTAGKYARTIGEFAPTALIGPGGVMRKAAMAMIPAVASESAGQLTEGSSLEPWARAGGALAGGLAAGMGRPASMAAKEAAKGAPTAEGLRSQTNAIYGQLRQAGIQYDPAAFVNTVDDMKQSLLRKGMRPSVVREAFDYVDDLAKDAGKALDFDDINSFRELAGDMGREAARGGRAKLATAWEIIRDKLDDFERSAPLIGNPALSPAEIDALRGQARKVALQNIKSRALKDIVQDAETYQGGMESGIRNQISNLLRSKRGKQLFTGAEHDALLEVAKGRKPLQTLSRFGFDLTSLSGNATFIPTLGAIGAGVAGGPLMGGALATAGTAAKIASPMLTKHALDTASAAIRSGKLSGQAGTQQLQRLKFEDAIRRLQMGGLGYLGATYPY